MPQLVRGSTVDIRAMRAARSAAMAARVRLAREDPSTFIELALKDDKTGKAVRQSELHEKWQRLITEHDRVVIWAHVEAGKSVNIAVGRVLWEIGKDPTKRAAIISGTDIQARRTVRALSTLISEPGPIHDVFPGLARSMDGPWNDHELTLLGHPKGMRDATVQSYGLASRSIQGSRIDLLVIDDILDEKNTASPAQMQEIWEWFHAVIENRMTATGKVVCIGTAWHPEDFNHRLAKLPNWVARRYPVLNEDGVSTWPAQWPLHRIAERRTALESAQPGEFARMFLCQPRDDHQMRFKRAAIDRCKERGLGKTLMHFEGTATEQGDELRDIPKGYRIYTGVDMAFSQQKAADMSCLFTIAVWPDGTREVLDVRAGRWHGEEFKRRILNTHKRFHSIFIVEDNGAQRFVVESLQSTTEVPVIPFTTTGRNKADRAFGVEAMAVEFDNAKWLIPNIKGTCHPEVEAWIQEMLFYDPTRHTGDHLIASWFAKEGARLQATSSGPTRKIAHMDIDLSSR